MACLESLNFNRVCFRSFKNHIFSRGPLVLCNSILILISSMGGDLLKNVNLGGEDFAFIQAKILLGDPPYPSLGSDGPATRCIVSSRETKRSGCSFSPTLWVMRSRRKDKESSLFLGCKYNVNLTWVFFTGYNTHSCIN